MTLTPRATQPRRWKSFAFASVTLAAAPVFADQHRVAPISLATPDTQLWRAQSQGGEGGEAGAMAAATPDAAYLAELMIVEGHMLAARDLYAMGLKDKAVELSKHPAEEGTLDALRKQIALRKAPDVADGITAFTGAMAAGRSKADVDAALDVVSKGFTAAALGEADQARTRFDAVVLLLKAAADEYQAAIKNGAVEDVMGWHEAWSFVELAREKLKDLAGLPLSAKAAPKAILAMKPADMAFGDPKASVPLAGDAQILLGVAARVELIASSVR